MDKKYWLLMKPNVYADFKEKQALLYDTDSGKCITLFQSTVMNADQIVVMKKGRIVEVGTHRELVERGGEYYALVKNQLELGN